MEVLMTEPAKKKFWKTTIEELGRSGLSQNKFAAEKGISSNQLSYWKSKIQREFSTDEIKASSFIPIVNKKRDQTPATIDPEWLAKLLLAIHREEY
jgi:hypothetical protein